MTTTTDVRWLDAEEIHTLYLLVTDMTFNHGGAMRKGQTFSNALQRVRPDMARKVTGTRFDPYYNDERISAFLEFIQGHPDAEVAA